MRECSAGLLLPLVAVLALVAEPLVAETLVAAPQDTPAVEEDPSGGGPNPPQWGIFPRNEMAAVSALRRSRAPSRTLPTAPNSGPPTSSHRQASLRQFEFLTKTGEFYAGFFLCILSYVPGVGCPLFTGPLDSSVESAASAEGVRVASAVFEGSVNGLVYFLQKKLDTEDQETTVMARINGPQAGLYLLQLRERGHIGANCSRVGGLFGPAGGGRSGVLGTISVDEYGAGLGVLTRRKVPMLGDDSVLGRSVVLVPRPEGGGPDLPPVACAVIARF